MWGDGRTPEQIWVSSLESLPGRSEQASGTFYGVIEDWINRNHREQLRPWSKERSREEEGSHNEWQEAMPAKKEW